MWNPLTEAATEGQSFKTEVAAVTFPWFSDFLERLWWQIQILVLSSSENGFQKFLAQVQGGKGGYKEEG